MDTSFYLENLYFKLWIGWWSYSCRWGWWVESMAGQVLWTTYFPQIHWAGRSGSLCAVYSDQATDKSLSWPGLSSLQAQNLSYQESSVHKGEKIYIIQPRQKKNNYRSWKGNWCNIQKTQKIWLFSHYILWTLTLRKMVLTLPQSFPFSCSVLE